MFGWGRELKHSVVSGLLLNGMGTVCVVVDSGKMKM